MRNITEQATQQDRENIINYWVQNTIDQVLEIIKKEYWKNETDDVISYYDRIYAAIEGLKGGKGGR